MKCRSIKGVAMDPGNQAVYEMFSVLGWIIKAIYAIIIWIILVKILDNLKDIRKAMSPDSSEELEKLNKKLMRSK
jgi:hypothetical protein